MTDELILTLLEKFGSLSIAELDLDDGNTHLILRKKSAFRRAGGNQAAGCEAAGHGSAGYGSAGPALDAAGGGATGSGVPAGGGAPKNGSAPLAGTADIPGRAAAQDQITSPIVATFYASPGPDTAPFASPGDKVKAGETLCILEAMKMMNQLEAEFDCEIISVHAASGDLVEYGQALFTVKRL
jgi:acetyl-CoA carboxylase biotin carboxyl carrier protein